MAARGLSGRLTRLAVGPLAFWLAALMTGALSLAAALIALSGDATSLPSLPAAADLRTRNERITFFEQRAAADALDYISLNVLAFEYQQRARETGAVDDYGRAEAAATRSLAILPKDNFGGSLALASVKLVQHDYAVALALSEQAIGLKPSEAAGYGLKGDALLGLGRYDEAGRAYQRQVETSADLSSLSRLAGLAFIRADNLNAEDFWKQAIERGAATPLIPRENLAWAQTQLGKLYFDRGDLDKAEKQYSAALRTHPDYVHALAGRAAILASRERWEESIGLYENVQQRLPQPEYVIALGDVYARAGRDVEARKQYELIGVIDQLYRAAGINTDLQLALFKADHGQDLDGALRSAEAAYAVAPSVYAADAYAWALFKLGRLEEADRLIAEALRLDTPEARFRYHAGMIRLALGDRTGAMRFLEEALRLNPYFSLLLAPEAQRVLTQLKSGR